MSLVTIFIVPAESVLWPTRFALEEGAATKNGAEIVEITKGTIVVNTGDGGIGTATGDIIAIRKTIIMAIAGTMAESTAGGVCGLGETEIDAISSTVDRVQA